MKAVICLFLFSLVSFACAGRNQGRSGPPSRPNPNRNFDQLYDTHKDTCKCHQQECLCCVKVPGLNYRSCVNYVHHPHENKLKVDVVFEGFNVISDKLSLSKKTQSCGKLPPRLIRINYCVIQVNRRGRNGQLESCTAFGFKTGPRVATLHLKCLTVSRSGLSYSGDKVVGHPGLIDYKRNVHFEGVINNLKREASRRR